MPVLHYCDLSAEKIKNLPPSPGGPTGPLLAAYHTRMHQADMVQPVLAVCFLGCCCHSWRCGLWVQRRGMQHRLLLLLLLGRCLRLLLRCKLP